MSLAVRRDGEGFRDSMSYDFADPEDGPSGLVRVDLRASGGRATGFLIAGEGAVVDSGTDLEPPSDWGSVELDGLRVSDDGERARVALENQDTGLEIELSRLGSAAFEPGSRFSDASGLTLELAAARVSGEWHAGDSGGRIDTSGRVIRACGEVDWDRIELLRSLTAVLEDGSLLAVASTRPAGASGHGEEAASALLLDSDGSLAHFEEPLLSTEYDALGSHRRVGVELWGSDEDAPALRGAGTLIGGTAETALMSFTLDGVPGTARYDLTREAR